MFPKSTINAYCHVSSLSLAIHRSFNQVCASHRPVSTWFLEVAFVLMSVCVYMCVCPPPRSLITSGMIWCDIDPVGLIKQVLWIFPIFQLIYMTLDTYKMDGHDLSNAARHELSCQ